MNRIVSIITPVHPDRSRYLADAYASIVRQVLPAGWSWEWLVQEDGNCGALSGLLPGDSRIRLGTGTPAGVAAARNLALGRATGALVKSLDADDVLCDGALARDIAVLECRDDIGWTAAKTLDLLPDGSRFEWSEGDPAPGRLDGLFLFEYWKANGFPPVVPGSVCMRRELLTAVGGWMAIPASEDTGALLAAATYLDGWFIDVPGLLYRKWPEQSTAQPAHHERRAKEARHRLIELRVQALLSLQNAATVGSAGAAR